MKRRFLAFLPAESDKYKNLKEERSLEEVKVFSSSIWNFFFKVVRMSLVISLSEFGITFTDRLIPVHLILPIAFEHRAYTSKLALCLHETNT